MADSEFFEAAQFGKDCLQIDFDMKDKQIYNCNMFSIDFSVI